MVLAVLGALRDGMKLNSVQPIQTKILESILVASFTITTLLLIIPCEFINGSPVPTLIFARLPSTFQAFVVCLVFAFAGSLSALLNNDSSFLVKFCEYSSMASMTFALSLLLWAMFTVLRNY